MKDEKIVIIGSSVAAISAIETIRSKDKKVKITVITKDKEISYSKPLISYLNISKEQFYYRDKSFFSRNDVKMFISEAIRIKNNSVILKDGKDIEFSKLLLAVGGKPIVPNNIKGICGGNVFTLTNFDDASKIKKYAKNKKSCLIIGCGMIGIKAAAFLKELGLKVTIVELMNRPFGSVLDEVSGKMVADEIRKNTKLYLNTSVTEIREKECVISNGERVFVDLVICAIGVTPNQDIAKKSGIKADKGIIVDSQMMTSKKNIFAAGDCASAFDILKGENRAIPIWPIAYKQGSIAGDNMIGINTKYEGGFVMNSVDVFGLPIITLGLSSEIGDEEFVNYDEKNRKYKKYIVRNDRIIGAILIGDIDRAGIITGLIKDKVDVSNFKNGLLKENFGYIYVPKKYRSKEVIPVEI
ncbi:MAG: hypothetical protein A2474_05620 [Elusimicrobia bacterium RIFOXYC2_FULL_34_12]|nr:MAG: hypothetical protein A2474_05620 [Elusimicrobia bacterium RIFOXYC2_FULL_34_12]OGS39555.1 MAG: hypothetical protein A2551_01855 [Elusimicrobia bacterium RIFOXYD2_FULL_34_30]HAM38304.1 NAD(P)/FAD-dependent oxidoreductase [Elusimicrobiota bacterium]